MGGQERVLLQMNGDVGWESYFYLTLSFFRHYYLYNNHFSVTSLLQQAFNFMATNEKKLEGL